MSAREATVHRKCQLLAVGVVLCLAVAGCSSVEVSTDWNREVDFSSYRTFSWLERSDDDPGTQLPKHLDLRLRRVVDDVLTEKGLQRAPVLPQADLLLAYYVGLERELRVDTYHSWGMYGYGYWPGSTYGPATVRQYTTGTVVLDVVDRRTQKLVWTGVVKKAVENPNPPSDRIQKVAERLLIDFPPR